PNAAWLRRAASSALIDEIRHRRASRLVPESPEAPPPPDPSPGPEQRVLAAEIGLAVRDCLTGLAEDRKRPVTSSVQGHSVTERARLLGREAKRAENLVYRGLADLRECLRGKGMEP